MIDVVLGHLDTLIELVLIYRPTWHPYMRILALFEMKLSSTMLLWMTP